MKQPGERVARLGAEYLQVRPGSPQFTPATDCTTTGVTQGGKTIVISGARTRVEGKFKATTAHEIGHALGLTHAGFTPCPPPGNGFGSTTYGDWFDPMGDEPFGLPQLQRAPQVVSRILAGRRDHRRAGPLDGDYLFRAERDARARAGLAALDPTWAARPSSDSLEVRGSGGSWSPYTYADPIANGVTIRRFWLDRRPEFADSRGSGKTRSWSTHRPRQAASSTTTPRFRSVTPATDRRAASRSRRVWPASAGPGRTSRSCSQFAVSYASLSSRLVRARYSVMLLRPLRDDAHRTALGSSCCNWPATPRLVEVVLERDVVVVLYFGAYVGPSRTLLVHVLQLARTM